MTNNSKNTVLKRKIETDAFRMAIRNWLSGEVTGHLGTYMYTDDEDDHRWKDGHSAATYYLGQDDKATFNLALSDIEISTDSFIDLGPGGEASVRAKSIPIMRVLQASNYYPVDLSPTLANEALLTVKNELAIKGSAIISDFFDSIPVVKKGALLAIMGGTIGNFETYRDTESLQNRLINIFSIYRKAVLTSGYFLISFDANSNGKEIINCYDNPEFSSLIRSCVERAIDTSGFDYHVAWTPENYQLATGLRANRDQIISFDDEQFAIENGEYLPVLNSYRFPTEFIKASAQQAGWRYQSSWSATGRIHYLLFSVGDASQD